MPSDAQVAPTAAELRQIAEDLVTAIAGTQAEALAAARADQRWDAHLGQVIREAWTNYQACAGADASDEHFRALLNRILAEGKPVF